MQKVRNAIAPHGIHRTLQVDPSSDPIISFKLNEYLKLSFNFNFGDDGSKELLFGLHFDFDSGIDTEASIQVMMGSFLNDTIGNKGTYFLGGFNFNDFASVLENDIMNSLVIGIHIGINVEFGLDLGNIFNETATSRLPAPILRLLTFDVEGNIGVNEWSTTLEYEGFELRIVEARALFQIEAGINSKLPLSLKSPEDFMLAISSTSKKQIGLNAALNATIPVFVIFEGLGYGATITYEDDDILDNVTQQPRFGQDVLISIELVQEAARTLKNKTAFLGEFAPLQQKIPLLDVSVNELIAGKGRNRTLADFFDLTDFANNLLGTQIASKMPSSSPSIFPSGSPSEMPSSSPSLIPSGSPSEMPSSSPSLIPSGSPSEMPSSSPSLIPSGSPSEMPASSSSIIHLRRLEYDDGVIFLTDLIGEIRAEFQKLIAPDTTGNFAPPVPDANVFNVIRPAGAICEGSDRALSIDIDRDGISTLNLTICALLEFELEGPFVSTGLLSAIEDSIQVDISGSFMLKGALMFGARLIVVKNTEIVTATIEFDPISVELSVVSDLDAAVSFGLLELEGNGKLDMFGTAELTYCPSCNGAYRNLSSVRNTSLFYFDRLFNYSLSSSIALSAGVSGVELDTDLMLSIRDDDVFDNTPPTIVKPDAAALRDFLTFSPKNAVAMLRLIDSKCIATHFCFIASDCLAYILLMFSFRSTTGRSPEEQSI